MTGVNSVAASGSLDCANFLLQLPGALAWVLSCVLMSRPCSEQVFADDRCPGVTDFVLLLRPTGAVTGLELLLLGFQVAKDDPADAVADEWTCVAVIDETHSVPGLGRAMRCAYSVRLGRFDLGTSLNPFCICHTVFLCRYSAVAAFTSTNDSVSILYMIRPDVVPT